MLEEEMSGSPPKVVARAVLENLNNPAPPARRVVGKQARMLWGLARFAPDSFRERLLRKLFFK
jgi:hypothetical protein